MFDRRAYDREYRRQWRKDHLERAREIGRAGSARWRATHPGLHAIRMRGYRAAWANLIKVPQSHASDGVGRVSAVLQRVCPPSISIATLEQHFSHLKLS